jgi:uncharacterized membrane protein
VIASIAADLDRATDAWLRGDAPPEAVVPAALAATSAAEVAAVSSGYLQYVGYRRLVKIAVSSGAVIELLHRPGHFLVAGRPLALVRPPSAAPAVATELARVHVTGPHRTLQQDPVFAVDQLVEIAIRALSPAVNDTFTALTCIDWLCAGLCRLASAPLQDVVHCDPSGAVRVIEKSVTYERLVNGAFDKIRQAGRGMPAVAIRQLDALARIMESTVDEGQRVALLRQATMIIEASDQSVPEPNDRDDIRRRFDAVLANAAAVRTEVPSRAWPTPGIVSSTTPTATS